MTIQSFTAKRGKIVGHFKELLINESEGELQIVHRNSLISATDFEKRVPLVTNSQLYGNIHKFKDYEYFKYKK